MPSQSPATIVANDIDLGNCLAYYAPSSFTSFANAKASTKWRKLGLMKEGVQVAIDKSFIKFFSGFPQKLQQQYVQGESLTISGAILETNPRALARIFGGLTITETVKATGPAASTVATGSTKTVVNFASAAGYKAGDEIRVGNSGSYQYGRIKSIATNAVTLVEALDNDTNPTTGHAVAKIDTSSFDLGSLANPAKIAIKIEKTMAGGYGTYSLYIPNAQFSGSSAFAFPDNAATQDGIAFPFSLEALSDPDVESGKLARWEFAQTV